MLVCRLLVVGQKLELVRMFRITEGQLAVSEEAFKIYRHETKEVLLDYIKANSKDKDKKWETYQKSLSKVKELR